jgi:hypothetical protein
MAGLVSTYGALQSLINISMATWPSSPLLGEMGKIAGSPHTGSHIPSPKSIRRIIQNVYRLEVPALEQGRHPGACSRCPAQEDAELEAELAAELALGVVAA